MAIFRLIVVAATLAVLFSGQARAYQYGYYAPSSYGIPRGYSQPYARAPYPYYYYDAQRYRAQPAYARATAPVTASATGASRNSYTPATKNQTESSSHSRNEKSDVAVDTAFDVSGLSNKKQQFINELLPYIEQENRRLMVLRTTVQRLIAGIENNAALAESEQQHIISLAKKYRVNGNPLQNDNARKELLRKIDLIPASLALAQAANESAWGESRFAREANNLFGIWTYDEGKGLKPKSREEGKTHLVRIFDGYGESVRYYMYTLNSHPAYEELRDIRQQLRVSSQVIDGHALAAGLEKYSAKGEMYIDLIQDLIKQNEWALLDAGDQST
jgi:Bax protein